MFQEVGCTIIILFVNLCFHDMASRYLADMLTDKQLHVVS